MFFNNIEFQNKCFSLIVSKNSHNKDDRIKPMEELQEINKKLHTVSEGVID